MKLYYSPGACSLSPHIVLRESGLPFETVRLSLRDKKLPDGRTLADLTPKDYVPVLELDDGQLLTEGPAIVQYVADRAPQARLAPPAGTLERYRLMEWLNYISTELHKQFSPLFDRGAPEELKEAHRARIAKRLGLVEQTLADGRAYLMGADFGVADAYLFTILRWAKAVGPKLDDRPHLLAYFDRVAARPAVHAALEAEGLVKKG
jgi:glutathione S-transferase